MTGPGCGARGANPPFGGRGPDADVAAGYAVPVRPPVFGEPGWRADDLVLVRESVPSLKLLMGMALQAYSAARSVPGVAALRAAGTRPLHAPDKFEGELFTGQATRMVLLPAEGTGHRTWEILAVASAARTDDKGQWWTRVTSDILRRLRPRRLWLPTASRLTRDLLSGHQLLRVIEETVDEVNLGGTPISVGPGNASGMMMIAFAIGFAATERDETVRRNLQGRVTAIAEHGRWGHGARAVPLGYVLGPGGGLLLDLRAGRVLTLAALLLSQPDMPAKTVREVMVRVGLRTPASCPGGRWEWDEDSVAAEIDALQLATGDAPGRP